MFKGILKFKLFLLTILFMCPGVCAQDGMIEIDSPEQNPVPVPVTIKSEIQNRLATFKGAVKRTAKPLPQGNTRSLGAIVMHVSGRCQWRADESSGWNKAAVNDSLGPGAFIRTGLNSTLTLRCGLNSTVLVDSNSRVQLPSLLQDGDVLRTIVTINRGRADIQVDRVGLMNDFSVLTPSGSLAVKGTGMGVQYDGFTGTSVVGARHNRMNAIEMRYFMSDGYRWLMSGGAVSTNGVQNPATVAALETQPSPSLQAYEAEDAGAFDSAADQALAATDTTTVTTRVVLAQQQQLESEAFINTVEQEVIAGILAEQEAAILAAIEAAEVQLETQITEEMLEEAVEDVIQEEIDEMLEEIIEDDEEDDTQPPQDILNSIGYSQYFGQMNGPSDQGFLAAAMALDLVAVQDPNWSFAVAAQIQLPGLDSDRVLRRQIPVNLEPILNALGDSNARQQNQFDPDQFDTFNGVGQDLFAFYESIAAFGAANPQWYQANGAPPTRADLALMVDSYETYIKTWTDGNLNTEQARVAFTDALYVLYFADPVNKENSQFTLYGQALLGQYSPESGFSPPTPPPPQNSVPNGQNTRIDQ